MEDGRAAGPGVGVVGGRPPVHEHRLHVLVREDKREADGEAGLRVAGAGQVVGEVMALFQSGWWAFMSPVRTHLAGRLREETRRLMVYWRLVLRRSL